MLLSSSSPRVDIHSTAIVDESAELEDGVSVGPYSVIGPRVRIGAGTEIGPHVLIDKDTTVGRECSIFKGAVLGTDPQDLKYQGEPTTLHVGDRTTIREYCTLNRGTTATGRTVVGSDCLLMAYVHVAHDSRIGNHVILANSVNMAGHVTIGDWVIISGVTPIHQFVRIGAHAFIGGASRVVKDIPPYVKAAGNPIQLYGLNSVGLAAPWLPRGRAPRAEARLPPLLRVHLQHHAGARPRPGGAARDPGDRRLPRLLRGDAARGVA
jgi:UDP-N-acetylglucosamine acyltransferase